MAESTPPTKLLQPLKLVRPVVLFATLVVVVFAILQGFGRIAMSSIHLFEDDINAVLSSQKVVLVNVVGSWRGFNPILSVDQIAHPAAEVSDVTLELDVLESLFRGQFIPRRILFGGADVHFEQVDGRWILRGGQSNARTPDITPIVQNLDSLIGELSLHFASSSGEHAQIGITSRLANRGGQSYLQVGITNPEYVAQRLDLRLWQKELLFSSDNESLSEPQTNGENASKTNWFDALLGSQETVVSVEGKFTLPAILSGMSELQLAIDAFTWRVQQGAGAGMGQVSFAELQLPGTSTQFAGGFNVNLLLKNQHISGELLGLQLNGADAEFDFQPIHLQANLNRFTDLWGEGLEDLGDLDLRDPPLRESAAITKAFPLPGVGPILAPLLNGGSEPAVKVWIGEINLGELSEFLGVHAEQWRQAGFQSQAVQAASDWISGMQLTGMGLNAHVFFDPEIGLGYTTSIVDVHSQAFKGAPSLTNIQGTLWGYGNGIALQLNSSNVDIQFPDLFHQRWHMNHLTGHLEAWFKSGYLALLGKSIKAQIGDIAVGGDFSLDRPQIKPEQRIALRLNLDALQLLTAKEFIPYKIPSQLAQWLEVGPIAGQLHDVKFAYQGMIHADTNLAGRRIELLTHLSQAEVKYDPNWPRVTHFEGLVHVAGQQTKVGLESAQLMGISLVDSHVAILAGGAYADMSIVAQADAGLMLNFVRNSPLQDSMKFITPQWQADGVMNIVGDIKVPIKPDEAPDLAVALNFDVQNVRLDMPEYRSEILKLQGAGTFSLPHALQGTFAAELFRQPATIIASYDEDWLKFAITGEATPDDIYKIISYNSDFPARGVMSFDTMLNISMGTGVTNLEVATDLQGLQIDLPAEFGKSADEINQAEISVQFLRDYQSVSWRYKSTNGWLHYGNEIERGAIGIGIPPPMTQQNLSAIKISGHMPKLTFGDWVAEDGEGVALPVDWIIRDLHVDTFVLDELSFEQLTLNGAQDEFGINFEFASSDLAGIVELPNDGILNLSLTQLRLPVAPKLTTDPLTLSVPVASTDPIAVRIGRSLPEAKVSVDRLLLGDEEFGAWRFQISPSEDTVDFLNFAADVKGVHIANELLSWNLEDNLSSFSGVVKLDDLEQTLPKWGYAANLQTDVAGLDVDATWTGSPANVNLLNLDGTVRLRAEEGRFLEVTPGQGVKILSLVNFSKIAKRISFDFSDVGGKGISFDELDANVSLKDGHLNFLERMNVESSSGNFQFAGNVDLNKGLLDNEMVVTLPVSNSLPWYGVYLALANPLAGLGVLLGERVLRKPIQQFSTAKFSVKGTLDDPDVKFVSLWDKSMALPLEKEPGAQEATEKNDSAKQTRRKRKRDKASADETTANGNNAAELKLSSSSIDPEAINNKEVERPSQLSPGERALRNATRNATTD